MCCIKNFDYDLLFISTGNEIQSIIYGTNDKEFLNNFDKNISNDKINGKFQSLQNL